MDEDLDDEALAEQTDSAARDFALVEYKESSTAFFKGVDIGFSFLRFFFIINAALATVLQLDDKVIDKVGQIKSVVPYAIPAIGIVFSLLLLGIIPYYSQQLDLCSRRCSEIEKKYGGKLFGNIYKNLHDRKRPVTATLALGILAIIVLMLWVLAIPGVVDFLKSAVSRKGV
jgi:hypothetical protein